ncbi:MAG: sensor domain-containing diguanylate cyclase [Candidatus Eremiobacteraeota bacterium]|nr:sensor domain-containing diguanylate cyclase [Candidatus Eremiobacteraeota bacterium]MCL5054331.1 sensor domain-containing diguanylate cyclase [Bacillota bacterium]
MVHLNEAAGGRLGESFLQANSFFKLLVENSQDILLVLNEFGVIDYVNPTVERVLGYRPVELEDEKIDLILHSDYTQTLRVLTTVRVFSTSSEPVEMIFLHKDGSLRYLEAIVSSLSGSIGFGKTLITLRDVTQRKEAEIKLYKRAYTDPLTGLPNRSLFSEKLQEAFNEARGNKEDKFAVLFLDLNGFKQINDTFGHLAGDEILIEVARRLERVTQQESTMTRFGGDEFVILLRHLETEDQAYRMAELIQKELSIPFSAHGVAVSIGVSIGISFSAGNWKDAEEILENADKEMYSNKERTRNSSLTAKC